MWHRLTRSPWMLAIAIAACGEVSPTVRDIREAGNQTPDVPRLADATILVPSDAAATADGSPEESGGNPPEQDAWPDAGGPVPDPGGSQDLPRTDPGIVGPDPGSPGDPGGKDISGDGELPDAPPCGPEQRPCDSTQVCVWDSDGASRCVPMAECSDRGAIDLDQLIRWFLQGGQQEMAFKVRGQPWVGRATCGGPACAGDCCRSCWAFLFLGNEQVALPLMGQGVPIACQGNECDWMDHCAPLTPGRWYWIWGRAERLGTDFRLLVDGFCPADAAPETD
ncbi:hypothetical protein KBD49_13495 [Myxococcota bacterium]|nr:hypothetical protein [Myxococcota bacterium]